MDRFSRRRIRNGTQTAWACVPLSGMFGYSTDLRSRTRGRATHSMQFDRYAPCPTDSNGSDDDRIAPVTAPVKHLPGGDRQSAAAMPEPDEDDSWIS